MLRLVLMPIVAGVIATGGMTAFLWSINRTGWTNADMVRAVGSLATKSYDNALRVGLIVHFVNGIIFAGITGKNVCFDANGDAELPGYIIEIKGNQWTLFDQHPADKCG